MVHSFSRGLLFLNPTVRLGGQRSDYPLGNGWPVADTRSSLGSRRTVGVPHHLVDVGAVAFDHLHVEAAPCDVLALDPHHRDAAHGKWRTIGVSPSPAPFPDLYTVVG